MARNRRNQSGAIRFVPALKAFLLCLLLGGSAAGYVIQKNKIYELSQQIAVREERLERFKREIDERTKALAEMQMPQKLAERVRDRKLGLMPPHPSQIIWLPEPTGPAPTTPPPAVLVVKK